MQSKLLGKIVWYDSNKKRGYILGLDEEKYYFDYSCQVDIKEIFFKNEQVKFIPFFEYEIPYAKQVEKVID